MPEFDTEFYVPAAKLAEILSLSDSEVGRLARGGVLPRVPHDAQRRTFDYPLIACLQAYIRHRNSKAQKDQELYNAQTHLKHHKFVSR